MHGSPVLVTDETADDGGFGIVQDHVGRNIPRADGKGGFVCRAQVLTERTDFENQVHHDGPVQLHFGRHRQLDADIAVLEGGTRLPCCILDGRRAKRHAVADVDQRLALVERSNAGAGECLGIDVLLEEPERGGRKAEGADVGCVLYVVKRVEILDRERGRG